MTVIVTVFFFLSPSNKHFQYLGYHLEPEHILCMLPCHEKAGAMRILRIHVLGGIVGSSSLG